MGRENGASSLRPEPRGQRLESGAAGAEAGPGQVLPKKVTLSCDHREG